MGTGTVPVAALTMLDPASAPGYHGQELITPTNSKTFMLGTVLTGFEVQGATTTGTFTTTN